MIQAQNNALRANIEKNNLIHMLRFLTHKEACHKYDNQESVHFFSKQNINA